MAKLRVAMIAPPWLALPIKGYGGIELVIEGLIHGLLDLGGVDVEVFGNGARKMRGVKTHSLYKEEQFEYIQRPYYDVIPILHAHMSFALNRIIEDGKFDIIHDHNTFLGPTLLSYATYDKRLPPVLHTLHGPPPSNEETLRRGMPDNRPQFEQLRNMGRMYMVGISEAMNRAMPEVSRNHILRAVHNAVDINNFPFVEHKENYYITLARFTPDKGQHIAIKYAVKHRKCLRMAGTVAGIGSNRKLLLELSNPLSEYRSSQDFRYYSDKIWPSVIKYPRITYSGNLSGKEKMKFISESKALLFPIDWEEPFGMAVIEALACGTPVVAMKRGAMPEIIQQGVNGFLANNEREFEEYMLRVDEVDPLACRKSVEDMFSTTAMARSYVERYQEVIKLAR